MIFLYIGYFLGIVSIGLYALSFFLEEPEEFKTFQQSAYEDAKAQFRSRDL